MNHAVYREATRPGWRAQVSGRPKEVPPPSLSRAPKALVGFAGLFTVAGQLLNYPQT